jgi:hypothetical protein
MRTEISSLERATRRSDEALSAPFGIKEIRVGIHNPNVYKKRNFMWVGLAWWSVGMGSRDLFGKRNFVWV